MNLLRTQWGQATVACVSQATLDSVVNQIGVFVDYKFAFFDAEYHHTTGGMQTSSVSDYSLLSPNLSQVKNKKVSRWHFNFLDNFWYNAPFYDGQQIDTYIVRNENDEIAPLKDPNLLTEFGYISFVMIQD